MDKYFLGPPADTHVELPWDYNLAPPAPYFCIGRDIAPPNYCKGYVLEFTADAEADWQVEYNDSSVATSDDGPQEFLNLTSDKYSCTSDHTCNVVSMLVKGF